MRTFPYTSIAILALILLLIDAYAYKGWKKLTWPLPAKWLRVLVGIYWLHSVAFIVSMLWLSYGYRSQYSPELHIRASYLFGWGLATGIPKIIFILFHGAEDLIHFLNTISKKIFRTESVGMPGVPIDRATFLTKTGLA
ncbi:MAG: hypothetical protein KDD36_13685, partial [Flavobacteriales bacterium]|nr:hypothetical protein [Flavobacteriales bacterium]